MSFARRVFARQVGRNAVWELTEASIPPKRYYAKFWTSPDMFDRDINGREVISDLAEVHQWLMPAPIIFCAPSIRVVVAEQLPGRILQALVSGATRRLSTRRERGACHDAANGCLSLVLRLLPQLNAYQPQAQSWLVDHSSAAVFARINRLALSIRERSCFAGRLRELQHFPITAPDPRPFEEAENVLIYGDLSPANIIFDGSRIGLFDFEDLGIGPACRDYHWLEYLLETFGNHWRYRPANAFLSSVRTRCEDSPLRRLHRLDFAIMDLDRALHQYRTMSLPRRLLERAELHRAAQEFSACFSYLSNRALITGL